MALIRLKKRLVLVPSFSSFDARDEDEVVRDVGAGGASSVGSGLRCRPNDLRLAECSCRVPSTEVRAMVGEREGCEANKAAESDFAAGGFGNGGIDIGEGTARL